MDGDTNAIMEKIAADGSYTVRQRHWQKEPLQQDMPVAEELAASEEEEEAQESALGPDGRRRGQSVRRHAASGKTDCAPLHNNASNYGPVGMRRSVKAVVSVAVRAEDDGSQITCLASSSLIPGRGKLN